MFVKRLLPAHHISPESKEVVRVGMGMVATTVALVLRHRVYSATGFYDTQTAEGTQPITTFGRTELAKLLIGMQKILGSATVAKRPIHELAINGITRAVQKVVVHPGYKKPPQEMQSGDAVPVMGFLASSDDVALIKLQEPVTDVTPVKIHKGSGESGQIVEIIGAGATGMASSVNIRARLIAGTWAAPRRKSRVRVNAGGNWPGWPRTNSPAASYRNSVAAFTARSPTRSASLATPTGSKE